MSTDIDIDPCDVAIEVVTDRETWTHSVKMVTVTLTHVPTGVNVQAMDQRSEHRAKAVAMELLRHKLHGVAKAPAMPRADVFLDMERFASTLVLDEHRQTLAAMTPAELTLLRFAYLLGRADERQNVKGTADAD